MYGSRLVSPLWIETVPVAGTTDWSISPPELTSPFPFLAAGQARVDLQDTQKYVLNKVYKLSGPCHNGPVRKTAYPPRRRNTMNEPTALIRLISRKLAISIEDAKELEQFMLDYDYVESFSNSSENTIIRAAKNAARDMVEFSR